MSRLDVQFLDRGFHRVLFDAMPMPVFVVDEDVTILDYNSAASLLLDLDKQALRRRSGDVLKCLHATETLEGCGHSSVCKNCVVRKSVRAAFKGDHITREWARMELLSKGKRAKVNLRVSCQPFKYERRAYALLIVEGLKD